MAVMKQFFKGCEDVYVKPLVLLTPEEVNMENIINEFDEMLSDLDEPEGGSRLRKKGEPRPKPMTGDEINEERKRQHQRKRQVAIANCLKKNLEPFYDTLAQKAKRRVYPAHSALAYSYYRSGRLYLKENPSTIDSAAVQFSKLFNLCDSLGAGACQDLEDLLGHNRAVTLLDTLHTIPDDHSARIQILTQTLKNIPRERKGSRWWVWLFLAVLPYLYMVRQRRLRNA